MVFDVPPYFNAIRRAWSWNDGQPYNQIFKLQERSWTPLALKSQSTPTNKLNICTFLFLFIFFFIWEFEPRSVFFLFFFFDDYLQWIHCSSTEGQGGHVCGSRTRCCSCPLGCCAWGRRTWTPKARTIHPSLHRASPFVVCPAASRQYQTKPLLKGQSRQCI